MTLDFDGAVEGVLGEIDDPANSLATASLFADARARAEASRWYIHLPDGTLLHTWILDHDDHPPEIIHMKDRGKLTVFQVAEADLETRNIVLKLVQ